jgi:hypothetical protein
MAMRRVSLYEALVEVEAEVGHRPLVAGAGVEVGRLVLPWVAAGVGVVELHLMLDVTLEAMVVLGEE